MAEQGYVLDIDAKFIERLGKADEALDKFVKSTDKLSRQFDELASGGLSRFANAIDSIVQSISQVSRVDIGDMGISNASNSAAAAVDNINGISSAIQNVQEVSKRTTLSFDIGDYEKPSDIVAKIQKTQNAIAKAQDSLKSWQDKLAVRQEADPESQKADTKKAVRKIAEWEAQIKSLGETYQKLTQDLAVARERAQELANAANSTEFKDIATWKAIKEAQQELLDTGGFASRAEQQPIVDKFAQAQEQIKEQMVSTKESAEMTDDERYQMELRYLARRQKAQDDAAKEEQARLEENARVQNKIEESRYQQSLKHLDDESKMMEAEQKAKEEARRKYAEADTKNILERKKEREEAYIQFVKKIQGMYKQVLEELNQVDAQKYKLDIFKAKYGETEDTKKADEEILRRQIKLNEGRENLETKYQEHITELMRENAKNRSKIMIDNIERQTRIAIESQKRIDNEKKKNDVADAKRIHEERTTFSGAMGYSATTKSINDQIQAIKYLEEARNKLDKTALGAKEYKRQVKEINNEITRQKKEVDELTNKQRQLNDVSGKLKGMLGTMFSISAIRGYVNQIIQVRGEFELQQRALQALLQNKAEANKLWEQTVQLAVKSPFQVKELVTYTKQLAAYRVETEKLHDTTKMLADISAGLGVDMGRLILAFGQVKAANYLRGTELRQFSEAGINILDELARYYTAVEGKAVTVGQVFERVSKRMVSFQDVEKVLQNVTSAGGMFYQMQEIQAETLKGSISNLKDQLDLMLNDIGKSNEGILKGAVQLAALLIKNYNVLVPILTTVALAFAGMHLSIQKVQLGVKAISKGGANLIKGLVNPWTLALAAVSEVISAYVRYRQETNKITKEHNRLRDSLSEIELAFRDAMKKDAVDGMRNSLSQLVELAENEFQIDLKLNDEELKSMDFSALEAKFVELRDILFDSNAIAEKVKKGLASVKIWDSTFMRTLITSLTPAGLFGYEGGESMAKDIKDFEKAAQDALVGIQAESKRIANELQLNTAHMLRLPQAPLETNLQYVNRLVKAYEGLRDEMEMKNIDTSEIDGYIEKLRKHTNEASRELGLFFTKYEEQIVHLSEEQKKAFINNIVNSEGWSEYTKELIYNLYNLDLERVIPQALAQFDIDKLDETGTTTEQKDTRWENLLRTIKEANSAYKELAKTFDIATAKEGVLAKYTDALNDALSKVVINGNKLNAAQFLEIFDLSTEEGMLKALDMIAKEAPEAADKLKAKLEKGEIVWEAKIITKEDEDKKLTDYLESLFSGYELSIELDKMNIPSSFAKDFFDLEALSLSELRDRVMSIAHKFIGTDMWDEYAESLKRIDKMERESQQERLKTYLEYARDAVGERAKIKLDELRKLQDIELAFAEKEGDSEEVKATKASAKDRAAEKVKADSLAAKNKLEWEEFRKSDTFTRIFEDLDMASDALIEHALTRLDEFKNEWKDMPLEDMREVVDKMNQLRERIAERDPFGKEARELRKRVKEDGRTREAIEMENVDLSAQQSALEQYESELQTILSLKEQERHEEELMAILGLKNNDIASMEEQELRDALTLKKSEIRAIKDKIKANEASLDDQKLLKLTYEQQADELENVRQMANDLYSAFKDISDLFMDSDSPAAAFAEMGMSAADAVLNCFALQLQLKAAREGAEGFGKAMNTAMAVVGWIVMGVQLIGSVLKAIYDAHDKKLQKQIDKAQEDIDRLTKEYEKLEKAIDKAFSADRINDYSRAASNNIDQQIKDYERMIALEEDKKKTDNNQIDDWKDSIEELREQQREMWEETNSVITGGILDNVRDVARNFVDAWYEAFQETGDGLSGLEDDFNDMLSEIVKQQAALHIVGSYTDMYKDWLKEYVDAEHEDVALSAEEARAWAERVQQTFPELSTLLENFFTGTQDLMQSESEISGLSKGIQGVTETTAQVLEALLNSMRFYVADSNIRLRNIEAAFANDDIANNPLLNELRQQTALIRSIEEMFGSVIGRGNGSHSGAYLKVLM